MEKPLCPQCCLPLATAKAKQCFACGADWHETAPAGAKPQTMDQPSAAAAAKARVISEILADLEKRGGDVLTLSTGELLIKLENMAISDFDIRRLAAMPRIINLSLQGTSVTDNSLAHLSRLTELNNVNLSYCAITEAGLACLQEMRYLKLLRLEHTRVGDAGLEIIRALPSLQELWLTGSRVSEGAALALAKARPDMHVLHDHIALIPEEDEGNASVAKVHDASANGSVRENGGAGSDHLRLHGRARARRCRHEDLRSSGRRVCAESLF